MSSTIDEREALLPTSSQDAENGNGVVRKGKKKQHRQTVNIPTTTFCLGLTSITLILFGSLILYARSYTGPGRAEPGTSTPEKDSPHVVIPIGGPSLPPPSGLPRNPAYLIEAEHGAVASEEITCSKMATEVLKEGGNAVDAAITSCICIGLHNSFSSGIGGGGFMVIRVPPPSSFHLNTSSALPWSDRTSLLSHSQSSSNSSVITAIDFREASPGASHKDMYVRVPSLAQVDGLSVGVPGELKGLWTAWEMYGSGRMSWERLIKPNAELAAGGWRVSRELARRFRIFGSFMIGKPEWEAVYRPRGDMLVEGDWVTRTNYSKTLNYVAEHGVEGFYGNAPTAKGNWIAENMIATIQRTGGIMTIEDLQNYEPRVYPAVMSTYHGNKVYTTDAPSSGTVMLGMLNSLEAYNFSREGKLKTNATRDGLSAHRITEALKFAFGARSEVSDPADGLMSDERRARMAYFASKQYGKEVHKNITDDRTHTADYYNLVAEVPMDSGTTHMSTVDQWGGAVSLTSTVNLIFGSRLMDPATGVIFNDEQDDFSIPGRINAFGLAPSPFNYPEPGKRPLSSTAATIVERPDGEFYVSLGGSGGSRIFGAVAQVLLNLEFGMDLSEAIEAPRLHDQLFPAMVTAETGFEFVDDLKSRGHNVTLFDINMGVAEVQAVMLSENGTIFASSDSRKNGWAWGY